MRLMRCRSIKVVVFVNTHLFLISLSNVYSEVIPEAFLHP